MARSKSGPAKPDKQGRIKQLRAVFQMTRRQDPAVVWWMLLTFAGTLVAGFLIGLLLGHPIYVTVLSLFVAVMLATLVMARRAERAAFAQIAGQPGASGAALGNLRRGWHIDQQPAAVDPRTQDLVFRAIGRPGVVLVTEGPVPRVNRLVEQERKRIGRVLGAEVPVHVINAGDGEGQVPLRRLTRAVMKLRPRLTKSEVIEVTKRLRALGPARPPIPKGIDPTRARPDRRASRGR